MAVAVASNALFTLDELRQWSGKISEASDDLLRIAANGVSDYLERECRRSFIQATYTHDGSNTTTGRRLERQSLTTLFVENPPINSVSTLVPYNGGTAFTEYTPGSGTGDYVIHGPRGEIELVNGSVFTYPGPAIELTYSGGWSVTNLPRDLKHAALEAASWWLDQREKNRRGMTSVSGADDVIQYLTDAHLDVTRRAIEAYFNPWAMAQC